MISNWFEKYGCGYSKRPVAGSELPLGKLFFAALLFGLFLGGGCTETIDLELESTSRRLVVDGMVTNQKNVHFVRLSESASFFSDSASSPVSGADVTITDGQYVEYLEEASELAGFYITSSDFEGVPGRTYTLMIQDVDIDGDGEYETYSASSDMPPVSPPDSIDMVYDDNWEIWKVLLYASDNPDRKDFYLFRIFKNGVLISDNISEYSVISDKFFDGNRANGVWVQSLDASGSKQQIEAGDVITLQMCGITEEYFKFVEGVQRENRKQYPLFSGPPANAPGNISNDALGFFTAFSAAYASYEVDEKLLEQKNALRE